MSRVSSFGNIASLPSVSPLKYEMHKTLARQMSNGCCLLCETVQLTQNNEKEQRYLLGAFEQLVGAVHPTELMPKVPHILKAFYDNDILDESVIIEWDEKVSLSSFRGR